MVEQQNKLSKILENSKKKLSDIIHFNELDEYVEIK